MRWLRHGGIVPPQLASIVYGWDYQEMCIRDRTLYVALRLLQSPVFLVNSRLGLSTAARLRSPGEPVHVRCV